MSAGGAPREIERVWVLRAAPVVPAELAASMETWEIEQGYLAPPVAGEGELAGRGYPEGRLRRIVEPSGRERFFHTVKQGSGLVRIEHERELARTEFDEHWPRTSGRRLAKTRRRVRAAGLVWEIDAFRDLPLVMLEVELPDEAAACEMPAFLAPLVEKEVTFDARYRNFALATHGVPRDA
ncbi:MAG: adenylate cyclase [Phycisphaerales bacterium]